MKTTQRGFFTEWEWEQFKPGVILMGGNWGGQEDEYHAKRPWWWDFYLIWLYLKG